jgi:hypothetical protein
MIPSLLDHLLSTLPPATLAALAATRLEMLGDLYAVVGVPVADRGRLLAAIGQPSYLATIDDGTEFTLLIPESQVLQNLARLPDSHRVVHTYRFVRLRAILPWDTVGYGAAVFTALAAAGVSAGFFSGYTTDYLLISDANWPAAQTALDALITSASLRVSQKKEVP